MIKCQGSGSILLNRLGRLLAIDRTAGQGQSPSPGLVKKDSKEPDSLWSWRKSLSNAGISVWLGLGRNHVS